MLHLSTATGGASHDRLWTRVLPSLSDGVLQGMLGKTSLPVMPYNVANTADLAFEWICDVGEYVDFHCACAFKSHLNRLQMRFEPASNAI